MSKVFFSVSGRRECGQNTSVAALRPMPPWRIGSMADCQPVSSKRTLHIVKAAASCCCRKQPVYLRVGNRVNYVN